MNCRNWEERIALWAGGDLAPSEARDVEGHLTHCPDCQMFAGGINQSLETLRGAHAEPIAEAHFAAVRARVLAKLAADGRNRRKWVWLAAAVTAAAVFGFATLMPPPAKKCGAVPLACAGAPGPAVQAKDTNTGQPRQAGQGPGPQTRRSAPLAQASRGRRRKPVVRPAKKPEPLLVKLVTDDPDVVIYWFADTKESDK
jgi:hypothetical protein